jgi:hypothetical protein
LSAEGELPTAYDINGIAAVYRRRPLLVLRRSLQIGASFGRWFALRYLDSVNERADDMFEVSTPRVTLTHSRLLTDLAHRRRTHGYCLIKFLSVGLFTVTVVLLQVRAAQLRRILLELGPVCFLFQMRDRACPCPCVETV